MANRKSQKLKAADTKSLDELLALSEQLCEDDNYVDGIIIINTKSTDRELLYASSETKLHNIRLDSVSSHVSMLIESSENLIETKEKFEVGNIESIIYEFQNLALVIYTLAINEKNHIYLILINADKKNLGFFNLHRPTVRSKIEVAFRNSGLENMLT